MDKRIVESGLMSKGFKKDVRDHNYFIYYTTDGKKTPVKTKTSLGSVKYKTLGASLVSQMARQCRLAKSDFCDLVECPMSREAYEVRLFDAGEI